jgi:hypothetical protein
MSVQKESVKGVITRWKAAGVRIVAGGPLFTTEYETFGDVDHLVLNEAEITLPRFVEDFQNGYACHIYTTDQWADIRKTPIPLWGLINMKHYASINIQYSRGCPFNCEFYGWLHLGIRRENYVFKTYFKGDDIKIQTKAIALAGDIVLLVMGNKKGWQEAKRFNHEEFAMKDERKAYEEKLDAQLEEWNAENN